MHRADLLRVLKADLGDKYNPERALEFLNTLGEPHQNTPPAKRLEKLLESPPKEDTVLRKIYETPFVIGEVVVAGQNTRKLFPLTAYHPFHFRKTYLEKMSRWETSPSHEDAQSRMIWKGFQEKGMQDRVPLPLGWTPSTYRSELMEAKSLAACSPVHNADEPKDIARQIAQFKKKGGSVETLWVGCEGLKETADALNADGILHHDLHDQNLMISNTSPSKGILIDFETSEEDDRFGTLDWERACREDQRQLVEMSALILLCARTEDLIPKTSSLRKEVDRALNSSPKLLAVAGILAREYGPSPIGISN